MCQLALRRAVQVNAVNDRKFVAQMKAEQNPILQHALQFLAAGFQCFALGPRALALGDLTKKPPVLHQLIVSETHRAFYIISQHGFAFRGGI
jgi:hypothetical protein